MATYYFTYGTEGQPFVGGGTEIEAPDVKSACATFRIFHPDKCEGLLNCSSVYTEEQFYATSMAKGGNFGAWCHERITLTRYLTERGKNND